MENYVKNYLKEEIFNEFDEYGKKLDEINKNGVWVYRYLVKHELKTEEERLEYLKKVLQEEAGDNDVLIFKKQFKHLEVYVEKGEYRIDIPYKLVRSLSVREVKDTDLGDRTGLIKDKEEKEKKVKKAEHILRRVKNIILLNGEDKEEKVKDFKKDMFMERLNNKGVDLRKLEKFEGTNRELISTAEGLVKNTADELEEVNKKIKDWEEAFEEKVEKIKGLNIINKIYEAGYDLRIFVGNRMVSVVNYYRDEDVEQ